MKNSAEFAPPPKIAAYSPLVHRLSILLTLAVFPLIWVGGLVTTYGAGMAVPDWPGTYGWNMFLYPPSTWLYGGFDLMVEHGHRLLGSLVGLIAIALLVATIKKDGRYWFRWWCSLVLVAVIAQGVLGGVRVLLDERVVALIHGCSGQLFLAIATGTAVMSSRWWIQFQQSSESVDPRKSKDPSPEAFPQYFTANLSRRAASRALAISSTVLLVTAYFQVVAGAQLRHASTATTPGQFMGSVHLHLALALVVLLLSIWTAWNAAVCRSLWGGVKRVSFLILAVVLLQISLGLGTWLVNYALPWQELNVALAEKTITAKGYWESIIVTGHVACGALIISLSTMVCLFAWRSRVTQSLSENH